MKIAYFISPHGYGHATRSIAIMQALSKRNPAIEFLIISSLNEQVFSDSGINYLYYPVVTDVGFFQHNAFAEDIEKTLTALEELLPFSDSLLEELAQLCGGCSLICCDIAALGIAVGQKAGIPSILLENFTWDWIYQPYIKQNKRLEEFADYLRTFYNQAGYHIQMQPFCLPNFNADLVAPPVFRPSRSSRQEVFADLPINGRPVVLITLGGITTSYGFIQRLEQFPDYFFIIPSAGQYQLNHNHLLLPVQTPYYHPDMILGSDLVICKTGYSTMAEIYHSGVALAYVGRSVFPESAIIEKFVAQQLSGQKLSQEEFDSGDWLNRLPQLLQLPRLPINQDSGADLIADFLLRLID